MASCEPRFESASESRTEPKPPLEILPAEIWLKIFKILDDETVRKSATWVCKDFHRIIRLDSELSSYLFLKHGVLQDEAMEILRGWPKLKTLRYHGPYDCWDGLFGWKTLRDIECCPQIEKVITYPDDNRASRFYKLRCQHSYARVIETCIYFNDLEEHDPFSKGLPISVSVTHKLYRLHGYKSDTEDFGLFKELEKIEICEMTPIYLFSLCECFETILKNVPKLKKLKIPQLKGHLNQGSLILNTAKTFCPEIEDIYIGASGIYRSLTFNLDFDFPNLKRLTLCKFDLEEYGSGTKKLRYLSLNDCRHMFDGFHLAFPNLEEFHVNNECKTLDEDFPGICTLAQLTALKQLKTLEWTMMIDISDPEWAKALNNQGHGILAILKNFDLKCSIYIHFTDIFGTAMSFSKRGNDVSWRTASRMLTNASMMISRLEKIEGTSFFCCKGESNCNCLVFREI